jgi:hypothetical protein
MHGIPALPGLGTCANSTRPFNQRNFGTRINTEVLITATSATHGTTLQDLFRRRRERSSSGLLTRREPGRRHAFRPPGDSVPESETCRELIESNLERETPRERSALSSRVFRCEESADAVPVAHDRLRKLAERHRSCFTRSGNSAVFIAFTPLPEKLWQFSQNIQEVSP